MANTGSSRVLTYLSKIPRGWQWLGLFLLSGLCWIGIFWAISSLAQAVTVREMLGDERYWPPACNASPCVLSGLGGIVPVWERHVDKNLALGRVFVVVGVCASACEIAARRAHAEITPGAVLIVHEPTPAILS